MSCYVMLYVVSLQGKKIPSQDDASNTIDPPRPVVEGYPPERGSYICPFAQPPRQPATDAVCWPLARRWASSSSGSGEACSSPGSSAPWYCGHRNGYTGLVVEHRLQFRPQGSFCELNDCGNKTSI